MHSGGDEGVALCTVEVTKVCSVVHGGDGGGVCCVVQHA